MDGKLHKLSCFKHTGKQTGSKLNMQVSTLAGNKSVAETILLLCSLGIASGKTEVQVRHHGKVVKKN